MRGRPDRAAIATKVLKSAVRRGAGQEPAARVSVVDLVQRGRAAGAAGAEARPVPGVQVAAREERTNDGSRMSAVGANSPVGLRGLNLAGSGRKVRILIRACRRESISASFLAG